MSRPQSVVSNFSTRRWFRRMLLAILIAIVSYLVFPGSFTIRVLLAYDLGMLFLVGNLAMTMWHTSSEKTYRHSQDEEPSSLVLLSTVVVFTIISLAAISLMLDNTKGMTSLMSEGVRFPNGGISLLSGLPVLFLHHRDVLSDLRCHHCQPGNLISQPDPVYFVVHLCGADFWSGGEYRFQPGLVVSKPRSVGV